MEKVSPSPHTALIALLPEEPRVELEIERIDSVVQREIERLDSTFNLYIMGSDGTKREFFRISPEGRKKVLEAYVVLKQEAFQQGIAAGKIPLDKTLDQYEFSVDLQGSGLLKGWGKTPGLHTGLLYTDDDDNEPFSVDIDRLSEMQRFRDIFDQHKGAKTFQLKCSVSDGFKSHRDVSRESFKEPASTRTENLKSKAQILREDHRNNPIINTRLQKYDDLKQAMSGMLAKLIAEKAAIIGRTPPDKYTAAQTAALHEIRKIEGFQNQINEMNLFPIIFVLANPHLQKGTEIESEVARADRLKALLTNRIEEMPLERPNFAKVFPRGSAPLPATPSEELFISDTAGMAIRSRPHFRLWCQENKMPAAKYSLEEWFVHFAESLAEGHSLEHAHFPQLHDDGSLNLEPFGTMMSADTLRELGTRLKAALNPSQTTPSQGSSATRSTATTTSDDDTSVGTANNIGALD